MSEPSDRSFSPIPSLIESRRQVVTHTALVKAGVPGDLIVGEGMGHCFLYDVGLPEARDAYAIIARFFDEHLGAERK